MYTPNDWDIKKFLRFVLAVQAAIIGVVALDVIGIHIPIIRQLISFIYLTFVPGIIILRILNLHKLSNIEALLYTVGLSIAILMFTGLFMNMVYPFFSISGPISITPLIITISAIVLVLCVLSYMRDKDFSDSSFIDFGEILSPPALFLCLIPFLAIFGTYLMNFYQNNIILMFLIIIIMLVFILIAFGKFIPTKLYPLAVFVIALSLLYHKSLISMNLWGCDIRYEYYLCNLVKMNSIWDPTMPGACNAMLSLVILAPIYSIVSNMDLTWVFKIIYPFLFSLVSLGLYRIYQKQTNDKIAFLACFFFVSQFTFYTEMVTLARQEIAELFLVLFILLMVDKGLNKMNRSFLFIVFGISLAVSHYGLSYIYMFCLIFAWLILVSMENPAIQKLGNDLYSKFDRYKNKEVTTNPIASNIKNRTISSTFVLLFTTFTLIWYMNVSSSSVFNIIVNISNHVASSIFTDFLNPEAAQGLDIIMRKMSSPVREVTKYLYLLTQFFIAIGIITLLLKRRDPIFERFDKNYNAFSILNFLICISAIGLPYFASSLNTTRLYHITLLFLSPFCVLGAEVVLKQISKLSDFISHPCIKQSIIMQTPFKVLSVILVIFFLFNAGFIHEIVGDEPASISLNSSMDLALFNENEVSGAMWLLNSIDDSSKVYFDLYGGMLFLAYRGPEFGRWLEGDINNRQLKTLVSADAYVYLRSLNIDAEKILVRYGKGDNDYLSIQCLILYNRCKIYDSGDAQAYYR